MKKVMNVLNRSKGDRRGVTALEYGLIAAVIAVVIIAGASTLGNNIGTSFNKVSTAVSGANTK